MQAMRKIHPADRPTVPVFSSTRERVERISPSQHLRLRLMYAALKAGLDEPEGATRWRELAPLKANERAGVLSEVARLRAMSEADRVAELLKLKMEGNLP